MSDESGTPEQAAPPKANIHTSGLVPPPPAAQDPNKRKTARVDLAEAQPAAGMAAKSATTRITLPTMPTSAPAGFVPKTIRLTRPGARPTVPTASASGRVPVMTASGRIPAAAVPVAPPAPPADAKRQTSRIPLEAAMGTPAAPEGPKTIRLKRPTEDASTVRVQQAPAAAAPDVAAAAGEEERPQPTQRKTIRIKRTGAGEIPVSVPRSLAVARIEAAAAERAAGGSAPVGPVWPLLAAVAVIVTGVLVYALAVQALPSLGWKFFGQIVG